MKVWFKTIFVSLLVIICFALLGCAEKYSVNSETGLISGNTSDGAIYKEWVSPDGVHYWTFGRYGTTPRYDNDGNLVIDKR